uniref:Fe2OG dioxygenase domain-containing protein n=1 Tax=Amphimedon queenslandica TaxID=400682 RepID=A0A1X7TWL7_AMPQE
MAVPVVDFKDVLSCLDVSTCPQVQEIHSAFTTVGFVFITNHGIRRPLVDEAFSVAKKFFELPHESKKKYSRTSTSGNNGYIEMEQEDIDPTKPGDLKEAFNICSPTECVYPDDEVSDFKPVMTEILGTSRTLALKILEVMGHALKLQDPQFFVKNHQNLSNTTIPSYTTARVLYYPPLPSPAAVKPGQLRCGEHVDYGSITLLFQDPSGGLQVKQSNGSYIDVPYKSDAVLVNLGALMQNWTSDTYIASPHRVLNPINDTLWNSSRQSMAIFIHPDNDSLIECIDGSNKYPPVTAYEDSYRRLFVTYEKYDKTNETQS